MPTNVASNNRQENKVLAMRKYELPTSLYNSETSQLTSFWRWKQMFVPRNNKPNQK
jgi:hypothetical protein